MSETPNGYERLTFRDKDGRTYLGAKVNDGDERTAFNFFWELFEHLEESKPNNICAVIARMFSFYPRYSNTTYYVYDPFERLNRIPDVVRMSW